MTAAAAEADPVFAARQRALARANATRTTGVERALLFVAIVAMPLQDQLPAIGPVSALWIVFGLLGIHVTLTRLTIWLRVAVHPIFLTAELLLLVATVIESVHPNADYGIEIIRVGQMVLGATFIAAICRDRKALDVALLGLLTAGAWMSVVLFTSIYGDLRSATATNFAEASVVRRQVAEEIPIHANSNAMSYTAALAAVMALILWLHTSAASRRRWVYAALSLFCFVATFLPMSRSGVAIAILTATVVLATSKTSRGRGVVMLGVLALVLFYAVPEAALSRMTVDLSDPQAEGRMQVYSAALEALPECFLSGVGSGNFWTDWGRASAFASRMGVGGAHNVYLQIVLYWGVSALMPLLAMVALTYRALPEEVAGDRLVTAVRALGVASFLLTMVMHTLYSKEISVALGVIAGANHWIWPNGRAVGAGARTS
jgi:hypothetical protein